MIDIHGFLNSKDVAAHLRSIGYEFTAPEAALVVHLSLDATLDEKMGAWLEIAKTMPDCPMEGRTNLKAIPSFRRFLHEYVGALRRDLEAFAEPDGCAFSYAYREDGFGWQDYDGLFGSADSCLSSLRERWADDGDPAVTRFRLAKTKVDDPDERRDDWLYLNRRMQVMEIDRLGEDESDMTLKLQFDGMWFAIPTPFRRGDIVRDVRFPDQGPFVLDLLPTWGAEDCIANGFREDARVVRLADRTLGRRAESGDLSDSICCGYAMSDGGDVYRDHMGWVYLDLEYATRPLEGTSRWAEVVSALIKHEIDFDEAQTLLRYLKADNEAEQYRDFLDSYYNERYYPDGVWARLRGKV